MSDGPAYDLESDDTPQFAEVKAPPTAPPPAAAAPSEPAQETPPPAAPPAEPTEDADAIEVQGGKYVPLPALKATRTELQTAKQELEQLRQYYGNTQGWAPYVNFLQAHPELMQGEPVRREPAPAPEPTKADPRAERIAQRLDLYTADGKPDAARAADVLAIIDEVAEQKAQRAVQPITQQSQYERSVANYNQILNLQYPDGSKPDPAVLAEIWQKMPMEMTSDYRVALTLADAAFGNSYRTGRIKPKAPAPPAPPPPLETDSVGGRGRAPVQMTDFERRIARDRGLNDVTWADRTKGFTPKATNALED